MHYANPQMCIYLIFRFISNVCGQLITLKGSCVGACINATHIILKEPSASQALLKQVSHGKLIGENCIIPLSTANGGSAGAMVG